MKKQKRSQHLKQKKLKKLKNKAKVNGRIGFRGYTTADLVPKGQGAYTIGGKHITNCVIDFSNPAVLNGLLAYATEKKIPAVICTTGFSAEQVAQIKSASEKTAIFYSGNMSLGINLLIELAKKATQVFGCAFDVEIVEKHHNQKLDAPSGTALMIADGISEVMQQEPQYVYDRHSYRKKREKNEIGIHAVRGGTIVGEHEVIFAGHDEVLTITHQAQSKEVFAIGSINAAVYLKGKNSGMYDMSDMLQGK